MKYLHLAQFLLLSHLASGQTLFHYIVSDFDSAKVAAGSVPYPRSVDGGANGITGGIGSVVSLSPEVPTAGVPYGLGNRSIDCSAGGGVRAPGTLQLSNASIAAAGGFTYETWFRWNGGGSFNSLLDYAGTDQLLISGNLLRMGLNNLNYTVIASPAAGSWHYVAVVFKTTGPVDGDGNLPGNLTFHFDGTEATGPAIAGSKSTFGDSLDRPVGTGMHPAGFSGNYFDGLIYSPRVSLGALATTALLYNSAPGLKSTGLTTDRRLTADFMSVPGKAIHFRLSQDLVNWAVPGSGVLPGVNRGVTGQPGVIRATLDRPVSSGEKMFIRAAHGPGRTVLADYDGDGVSDWALAREDVTGGIFWDITLRGGGKKTATFGVADTDFLICRDFDGDGITDLATWSNDSGTFKILRSSDGVTDQVVLGESRDSPSITGDYDGDGIADPAVLHFTDITGVGPVIYRYIGSLNNPSRTVTEVAWGVANQRDLFATPGDFDGDGRFDFCYQQTDGNGGGVFHLLRSSDGGQETVPFGIDTDFTVSGDFDGDGRNDFCAARTQGGQRHFRILERDGGGTGDGSIAFDIGFNTIAPADYDGDGTTDLAVWGGAGGVRKFQVRFSSTGALFEFPAGIANDFALANVLVN